MLTHMSLFSGIGGMDLAADWAGFTTICQVEIDDFCQKVLQRHWPEVRRHGDIKTFDGTEYRGAATLITGGFPCQPFSGAGKQRGKADDRYLWPEMFRVISEVRPTWVIAENVDGFVRMALREMVSNLASIGYETDAYIIPACGKATWHRRYRVWTVAHAEQQRQIQCKSKEQPRHSKGIFEGVNSNNANTEQRGWEKPRRLPEPDGLIQMGETQSEIDIPDPPSIGCPPGGGNIRERRILPDSRITAEDKQAEERRQRGIRAPSADSSKSLSDTSLFGRFWGNCGYNSRSNGERGKKTFGCKDGKIFEMGPGDCGRIPPERWWAVEPLLGRVVYGVSDRMDRVGAIGNAVVPQLAYVFIKAIADIELASRDAL